jgi:hypothetical protein
LTIYRASSTLLHLHTLPAPALIPIDHFAWTERDL